MMKIVRLAVAAAFLAAALSPVLALPAEACSCAMPPEIQEWVDDSEAVFVGTLVEQQDAGASEMFGPESVYVFEVEEWVKGDLGDVVEIYSASDGAGCGFEFWDADMRTGAAIYLEDGQIRGGLCSQVDADVLLAAMAGPTPSASGVGHLLTANGWTSTQLTVLDELGHHVADLNPPGDTPEWSGTQQLDVCPGGELMVQVTQPAVHVWDMTSLEIVATHDISTIRDTEWPGDADCRETDASSIWMLVGGEASSRLVEVVPEVSTIRDLPGVTGRIGSGFVIAQSDHEGDATWVDLETSKEIPLTATPVDHLVGTSVAAHPSDALAAVLEVKYAERGPVVSTLTVFNSTGERTQVFELPGEAYDPRWIDDSRITVYSHDPLNWEEAVGLVLDTRTGEVSEIDGWNAQHTVADGDVLYGVDGGSVISADLTSGEIDTLVTLPSQTAGPLVILTAAAAVEPPTTTTTEFGPASTTPPLVAPDLDVTARDSDLGYLRWIAGGAIVGFLGILAWLAFRKPSRTDPT